MDTTRPAGMGSERSRKSSKQCDSVPQPPHVTVDCSWPLRRRHSTVSRHIRQSVVGTIAMADPLLRETVLLSHLQSGCSSTPQRESSSQLRSATTHKNQVNHISCKKPVAPKDVCDEGVLPPPCGPPGGCRLLCDVAAGHGHLPL